jgi:hypothetical protein
VLCSVCRLLVTASVVLSSPILVTLMKEALSSSETSVHTSAALRNIPEDTILHSHRRENLKSYRVRAFPAHLRTKVEDPASKTLCFLVFRLLGNGQSLKT